MCFLGLLVGTAAAVATEPLAPSQPGTAAFEIDTRLTVHGSLRATVTATVTEAESAAEQPTTTLEVREHAVNAEATISYRQSPSGTGGKAEDRNAVRTYRTAAARLEIDGEELNQQLPADARRIFWTAARNRLEPWLANGFLTRQEQDLLTVPFDLWWQDTLAPPAAAKKGTSWNLEQAGLARLLCIDAVDLAEVVATVDRVDAAGLTVTFTGMVSGAVTGAATEITVAGSYCWVTSGSCGPGVNSLTATIHEQRRAGHAGPGLDVEAVVETVRRPAGESVPEVTADEPEAAGGEKLPPRRGPGRPGFLWLTDPRGRFDLVHDARWRLIERQSGRIVLRLIDRGSLLGQATLIPLPPTADPPRLETFRQDIERSLEGQFNHVISAAESRRSNGTRLLRVASAGTADGLPFHWIHYHVSGPEGGRASLSFMVEADLIDRFAGADRQLVDGFALAGAELWSGDGAESRQRQASRLTAPRRD